VLSAFYWGAIWVCFNIVHPDACQSGNLGTHSETNSSGSYLFYAKQHASKFTKANVSARCSLLRCLLDVHPTSFSSINQANNMVKQRLFCLPISSLSYQEWNGTFFEIKEDIRVWICSKYRIGIVWMAL